MTQLTITEARQALLELPERLRRSREKAAEITRRGKSVLAVLPWEFYESLVETLDVLSQPELTAALRVSLEDLKRGRVLSHAAARKRLGV